MADDSSKGNEFDPDAWEREQLARMNNLIEVKGWAHHEALRQIQIEDQQKRLELEREYKRNRADQTQEPTQVLDRRPEEESKGKSTTEKEGNAEEHKLTRDAEMTDAIAARRGRLRSISSQIEIEQRENEEKARDPTRPNDRSR